MQRKITNLSLSLYIVSLFLDDLFFTITQNNQYAKTRSPFPNYLSQ